MGFDPNPAAVGAAGPGQGPLKSTLLFFHCHYFAAARQAWLALSLSSFAPDNGFLCELLFWFLPVELLPRFFWKRFSKLSLNGFLGDNKKVELSFGQNGRPDLNNRKLFSAFSISTIFFSFIREHAFGKISSTLVPLWRTRPKGSTHDDNCRLETTKRWSVPEPLFIQYISLGRWGILSRGKYVPHKFFLQCEP